jgi:hypothetical protein
MLAATAGRGLVRAEGSSFTAARMVARLLRLRQDAADDEDRDDE